MSLGNAESWVFFDMNGDKVVGEQVRGDMFESEVLAVLKVGAQGSGRMADGSDRQTTRHHNIIAKLRFSGHCVHEVFQCIRKALRRGLQMCLRSV